MSKRFCPYCDNPAPVKAHPDDVDPAHYKWGKCPRCGAEFSECYGMDPEWLPPAPDWKAQRAAAG